MASYQTNLELATRFTPFRQQLPVEEMVGIANQRQAMYNEGIQKIQDSIDKVAGLDVSKENQKQYLQSKLNELGTKLKTFVGADYSNFQLTNNVMGMTKEIANDPIIQGAVYSSQVIRKGQQEMEAAKQAGKSSPQNEAFWNKQISDWQNDGKLDTRFNGSYINYTDVGKKLREVADKMHEIDSSIDDPFQRNGDGSLKRDANGSPMVDMAMLETKTKGKPAHKLLENFLSSLDENDQQQLHIDSWYHYQGVSKEDFKKDLIQSFNNQKSAQFDKQKALALEIQTNSKLSQVEKAKLQAQLTDVTNDINSGKLNKELNDSLKNIDDSNLDSYKYNTYTKNYLSEMAQHMSYQSYEQSLKSNPYFQADMEMKKYNLQVQQMMRAQANSDRDFQFKLMAWQVEQADKVKKEKQLTGPMESKPKVVPEEQLTTYHLMAEVEDINKDIDALNTRFAPSIGAEKLTKSSQTDLLNGILSEHNIDPRFVKNPEMAAYLQQRRELEIRKTRKLELYNDAKKAGSEFDNQLNTILTKSKGVSTSTGNNYSAKDLYDVLSDFNKQFNKSSSNDGYSTGKIGEFVYHNYDAFMSQYKNTNKGKIAEALIKQVQGIPLSGDDRKIINRAIEINGEFDKTAAALFEERQKAENKYIAEHSPKKFSQYATLDLTNPNSVKVAHSAINAVLGEFHDLSESEKGKIEWKEFNPVVVENFMSNKNSSGKPAQTLYRIEKDSETGEGTLVLENSGEVQKVPLKGGRMRNFFPEVAVTNPYNESVFQVTLSNKNRSTNYFSGDSSNPTSALYSSITGRSSIVPNLNNTPYADRFRFEVKGAPFNDGSEYDRFLVNSYFLDDNGNWNYLSLTPYNYLDKFATQDLLQNKLGPATANEIATKFNSKLK